MGHVPLRIVTGDDCSLPTLVGNQQRSGRTQIWSTIPAEIIIADKEYALAAGAKTYLGTFGKFMVIFGALLATSSAISGTLFGASRLMAVIANDGYFPKSLGRKIKVHIPNRAIIYFEFTENKEQFTYI